MFRRRIPFTQIAFTTLLGVVGGIYIYRPYFEPDVKTPEEQQGSAKDTKWNITHDKYGELLGNTGHNCMDPEGLEGLEAQLWSQWTNS